MRNSETGFSFRDSKSFNDLTQTPRAPSGPRPARARARPGLSEPGPGRALSRGGPAGPKIINKNAFRSASLTQQCRERKGSETPNPKMILK
jgi:hypothetical protein